MNTNNDTKEGQENNSDTEESVFNFLKGKFFSADLTILLSLSSLISYGIYYFYQWMFLDYYHIDKQFIDLSKQGISSIIILLVLIATVLFLVISLSKEPRFFKHNKRFKIVVKILYILMIGLNVIGALFVLFMDGWEAFSDKIIVLAILVIPVAISIVFDDFKKLKPASLIFLSMAFTIGAASIFGEYRASTKTNYYILNKDEQKYVVIAPYDKQFIIAPVDLDKKVILSQFQFIDQKSGKDDKVELTPFHTGKLDVKKLTKNELK
ncbi:hypothetical protein AB3N02_30160 [Priestia aryabhattai]|uniref:hypothetical protein n=1 Tax=Priestia aryabhattai TaxID=412384 RepID=UPI0039A379BE